MARTEQQSHDKFAGRWFWRYASPAGFYPLAGKIEKFGWVLAIVLALATRHTVSPVSILSLLVGGLLVIANATAIGTLLQSWATLTPGVERFIQSVTLALIFTGGVFLALPPHPGRLVQVLLALNPFGALLDMARAPLLGDALHSPTLLLVWIALTLVAVLVARNIGPRLLPIVVERMGN